MRLYHLYERLTPARVRWLLRAVIDSPATLRQFVTYVLIGALAVGVDLLSLALLLRTRMAIAVALSLAFFASLVVHFALNKYQNFRNFDRPVFHQAKTYLMLSTLVWLFTIGWVELLVRYFGTPVLVAKVLAMPLTVVIGYLSTRFVTFGPGIGGGARMWLARRYPKDDRKDTPESAFRRGHVSTYIGNDAGGTLPGELRDKNRDENLDAQQ